LAPTAPCLAGAYDDDSSGQCVCVAAQANGAACTESDQCSSGFCDTGNTNTCIIEPQVSSLSTSACTEAFQSGSFF